MCWCTCQVCLTRFLSSMWLDRHCSPRCCVVQNNSAQQLPMQLEGLRFSPVPQTSKGNRMKYESMSPIGTSTAAKQSMNGQEVHSSHACSVHCCRHVNHTSRARTSKASNFSTSRRTWGTSGRARSCAPTPTRRRSTCASTRGSWRGGRHSLWNGSMHGSRSLFLNQHSLSYDPSPLAKWAHESRS
jgi:hypothetical protein